MKRVVSVFGLLVLVIASTASAQTLQAPSVGELAYRLTTPVYLGGGMHITRWGTPQTVALNPAAAASFQRVILDLNYINMQGITGTASGTGHAANLAISVPSRVGVWTTTLGMVDTQAYAGTAMEMGIFGRVNFAFSKEIYTNLWVGAGIDGSFGQLSGGSGIEGGAALNLGFLHYPDTFGGLKNFVWGITLNGLGYRYGGASRGYLAAIPENITPAVGAAFDIVDGESFRWTLRGDIRVPSFTDLWFGISTDLMFGEVARLSISSSVDLQDATNGHWQTVIPSAGLALHFPLGGKRDSDENDEASKTRTSEIDIQLAAAPLYDGVWAFGGGVTLPFGVRDADPPEIAVDYEPTDHISPNYDGIQDELNVEYEVTDARYVTGYEWTVTDEDGNVVRTFRNKDERPENETVGNLWSRLVSPKTGTPLPDTFRWDGVGDDGALVSDGNYFFSMQFSDDNNNTALDGPYPLVVDTLAPDLQIRIPEGLDLIFSPDGDANKDTFLVEQTGSVEHLWETSFQDASDNPVAVQDITDGAPENWEWGGQDDAGQVVPDGVYRYRIASTDKAGNATEQLIEGIIIDTVQPPTGLTIDRSVFSPGTASPFGDITFVLDIPVKTGIVDWSLDIRDSENRSVKSWTRRDTVEVPSRLVFEGRDAVGTVLDEGIYRGVLSIDYRNGYRPVVESPPFVVDVTAPVATVDASTAIFSPDDDGRLDAVTFTQESSAEEIWEGILVDPDGAVVKTWRWLETADSKTSWDGRNDDGRLVPDGTYFYRLQSTDRAGNKGKSTEAAVIVDTSAVEASVTASKDFFNDRLTFFTSAKTDSPVAGWSLSVVDADGREARRWSGDGAPPESVEWNGRNDSGAQVPDGPYRALLSVRYQKGTIAESSSTQVEFDTAPPRIDLSVDDGLFSPDGDGRKDSLIIAQSSSREPLFEGVLKDAAGLPVRVWRWTDELEDIRWDGTDDSGNPLPDGSYRYEVTGRDRAGNATLKSAPGIVIDTAVTSVYLTASSGFVKAGETDPARYQRFTAVVPNKRGITEWRFTVEDESGTAAKTVSGTGGIPGEFVWDGRDTEGDPVEGTFIGALVVQYAKGSRPRGETRPFISDGSPPVVNIDLDPQPFSPDDDNVDDELIIGIAVEDQSRIKDWSLRIRDPRDRDFITFNGQGRPSERIIWDGRSGRGELVQSAEDYPYTFTVTDVLGHTAVENGNIAVDVLVIRDGDRLKIQISNITFAPYSDVLVLSGEGGEKNSEILDRLAQILSKYGSYRIIVEGHAVSEFWDNPARAAREEREELEPLSTGRAQSVKDALTARGINSSRMEARGLGGTQPVVPHGDLDNRWKNRRVEFILVK